MLASLDHLIRSVDDRRQALLNDLEGLSAEELQTRPGPEAWSIPEIVEHLVIAESVVFQGLPQHSELCDRPRTVGSRIKYLLVSFLIRGRVPITVPSRFMLPTGRRSLAELRKEWDSHLDSRDRHARNSTDQDKATWP